MVEKLEKENLTKLWQVFAQGEGGGRERTQWGEVEVEEKNWRITKSTFTLRLTHDVQWKKYSMFWIAPDKASLVYNTSQIKKIYFYITNTLAFAKPTIWRWVSDSENINEGWGEGVNKQFGNLFFETIPIWNFWEMVSIFILVKHPKAEIKKSNLTNETGDGGLLNFSNKNPFNQFLLSHPSTNSVLLGPWPHISNLGRFSISNINQRLTICLS